MLYKKRGILLRQDTPFLYHRDKGLFNQFH